jgi:hypothetical protein
VNMLSTTLSTISVAVTFWAAVGVIALSGLLALSKAFLRTRAGLISETATRGIPTLFVGLVTAGLVLAVPSLITLSTDVANSAAGAGSAAPHRPSLADYLASLPDAPRWTVAASLTLWFIALVASITATLLRRRQLRRLAAG